MPLVIKNPNMIRLKRNEESLNNIKQYYVNCRGEEAKSEALSNLYGVLTIGQAMVFCHVSGEICLFLSLSLIQCIDLSKYTDVCHIVQSCPL